MGRWQREALTEVLWREVAAPPPSPAATVPLPIASRQGGWDGRYQPLPVVNPPSNQKHHRGGKKYCETLQKQPEIIVRPDRHRLAMRRQRRAQLALPVPGRVQPRDPPPPPARPPPGPAPDSMPVRVPAP